MARVIIDHPDGRSYAVEPEVFFRRYRDAGFVVRRQLYASDMAGVLGDPDAPAADEEPSPGDGLSGPADVAVTDSAIPEPDPPLAPPAIGEPVVAAKVAGEPYATTIVDVPRPEAIVQVPDAE